MAKTPPAPVSEDWVIMDIGSHLGVRYSTARDMMLSGKFGDVKKDGRHRTVSAEKVRAFKVTRDAKRAAAK